MMLTPSAIVRQASASSRLAAVNDNCALDIDASDVVLSQYYTSDLVARRLYAVFCERFDPAAFQLIEPSAGTGSFFRILPRGTRAFDIEPKCPGIETADFLTVRIDSEKPVAIIGNPPFSDGMAVGFFNHAASQAEVIALILPRSFRKASIQNKLDRDFHLLHEEDVERDAFIFRSKLFHAPAVFQIWVRRGVKRELRDEPTTHPDFEFLRASDHADFAVQRIGSRAGRVHDELHRSREAHYFIRANRPGVEEVMRQLDFASVARDVASNPSLSKSEIVRLYGDHVEQREVARSSQRAVANAASITLGLHLGFEGATADRRAELAWNPTGDQASPGRSRTLVYRPPHLTRPSNRPVPQRSTQGCKASTRGPPIRAKAAGSRGRSRTG